MMSEPDTESLRDAIARYYVVRCNDLRHAIEWSKEHGKHLRGDDYLALSEITACARMQLTQLQAINAQNAAPWFEVRR